MKKLTSQEKDELIQQLKAKLARAQNALNLRNIDTRQLSSEVHETQLNLNAVLNQMPAMLWAVDKNFNITTSLGSGLPRINVNPNELVGTSLYAYLKTDDPTHPSIVRHKAAMSGIPQSFEQLIEGKVLAVHIDPLRNETGEIKGCIGVGLDITETKRLEDQLMMQQQILELIAVGKGLSEIMLITVNMLEAAEPGMRATIFLLDSNTKKFKLGAAPHLSKEYITLVESMEIGEKAGTCGTAAYLGRPVIVENTFTDPLWSEYRELAVKENVVACWSHPIFSSTGKIFGTFALHYTSPCKPSTNQMKLLATMAHLISIALEKQEHDNHLSKILKELERSNSELEQFAYATSHDLQEPLRTITSYLQLISKNTKLDEANTAYMNFVFTAVSRLRSLINDLLVYARVGSKRGQKDKANCENILNEIKKNLETSIRENNVIIKHEPLPIVSAAHADIYLLFQNLINNAIKYKRDPVPTIEINTISQKGFWLFSIKDNGLGIAKEHIEQLFQVFRRLHTAHEYPGTGVGLALCKKVVEIYGGKIWIESELGVGTTFFFTLPQ